MRSYADPVIVYEPDELRVSFEQKPFSVLHDLRLHPLFTMEALMCAADRLPARLIECNAGDVPVSHPEGKSAGEKLSPREIVCLMSTEKVWLGLKKIDLLPEYADLLDSLLRSVKQDIERSYNGMHNFEGYVFISSPGTVVPYHMDPEHNFLLQIRGEKSIYLFDRNDPQVLTQADIECFYTARNRRMSIPPAVLEKYNEWRLCPGEGIHVPINSPHYVRTWDEISISLSVTFDSARQKARERVMKVNSHLRKAGLQPCAYGVSPVRDSLKSGIGWLYQSIARQTAVPLTKTKKD
jgi:Cupin-like domain